MHLRTKLDLGHVREYASPHEPIETLLLDRHRTQMVFKPVKGAQKSWRRLDGHSALPKQVLGVKVAGGLEVIAGSTVPQPATATE